MDWLLYGSAWHWDRYDTIVYCQLIIVVVIIIIIIIITVVITSNEKLRVR
jgi:hypothetical protein